MEVPNASRRWDAYRRYPWLIHRLTYRRTNHHTFMCAATSDCVPKLGYLVACAKQEMRDELIEHKQYITRCGDDMPEVKQWRWPEPAGS
jgi:xylulose-5-phosphate/fructose-6-phosphate phosphoketolase